MTWLLILAYLSVQIFIGIWISKRIKSESDFLLGGRRLSLLMVSFSLFATWFGTETCIGSSAAVYDKGLSGSRADPFGYSICLLLMGLLLAARLRRAKYVTLADYFRERYGSSVEKFAIWLMVPSSLFWAAAQGPGPLWRALDVGQPGLKERHRQHEPRRHREPVPGHGDQRNGLAPHLSELGRF